MIMHSEKLAKRMMAGNHRSLLLSHNLIDFASNDYLGLARSPLLFNRFLEELRKVKGNHGTLGSTGSRLLTGNSHYVQELENQIANFHGYTSGTLFNCGYMANLGLLSAIASENDTIFFDAQIHASMRDGLKLSQAAALPFKHNDAEHLEKRLKNSSANGNHFICIESIYSTDGLQAPLQKICALAKQYGAKLIVDEAHAVGIHGPQGKGLVAENELGSLIFAQVITFGKALGTHGAIVLGDSQLKELLINLATSFIYTTALPFYSLAAIKASYDLFPKMELERCKLFGLIASCKKIIPSSSDTQIQPILVPGNQAVKEMAKILASKGFDLRPLTSPTVRKGAERLRLCLHAHNNQEELLNLFKLISLFQNKSI